MIKVHSGVCIAEYMREMSGLLLCIAAYCGCISAPCLSWRDLGAADVLPENKREKTLSLCRGFFYSAGMVIIVVSDEAPRARSRISNRLVLWYGGSVVFDF
jgi:hypothetical protein